MWKAQSLDFVLKSVKKYRNMASVKLTSILRMARSIGEISTRCRIPLTSMSPVSVRFPPAYRVRTYASEEAKEKSKDSEEGLSETERKYKMDIEELNKDLEVYKEKSRDFEDKYKRALADGENLRKRMARQVEDAKVFSIQGFCKDLLAVADTLAIATTSVPEDQVSEANPHLKSLLDGLTLTEAQLTQVFKRHGLEIVNPVKEKFNPNLHEALFVQEVDGEEPGTVVVVSKVGYKLQERCVRPALVGVAK